jgi:hypothetical protein
MNYADDIRAQRGMEPWSVHESAFDDEEMRKRALEAMRPSQVQQYQPPRQQQFIRLGQQQRRLSPRQMALARLQQAIPGAPR